jgi:hypothetical protein
MLAKRQTPHPDLQIEEARELNFFSPAWKRGFFRQQPLLQRRLRIGQSACAPPGRDRNRRSSLWPVC